MMIHRYKFGILFGSSIALGLAGCAGSGPGAETDPSTQAVSSGSAVSGPAAPRIAPDEYRQLIARMENTADFADRLQALRTALGVEEIQCRAQSVEENAMAPTPCLDQANGLIQAARTAFERGAPLDFSGFIHEVHILPNEMAFTPEPNQHDGMAVYSRYPSFSTSSANRAIPEPTGSDWNISQRWTADQILQEARAVTAMRAIFQRTGLRTACDAYLSTQNRECVGTAEQFLGMVDALSPDERQRLFESNPHLPLYVEFGNFPYLREINRVRTLLELRARALRIAREHNIVVDIKINLSNGSNILPEQRYTTEESAEQAERISRYINGVERILTALENLSRSGAIPTGLRGMQNHTNTDANGAPTPFRILMNDCFELIVSEVELQLNLAHFPDVATSERALGRAFGLMPRFAGYNTTRSDGLHFIVDMDDATSLDQCEATLNRFESILSRRRISIESILRGLDVGVGIDCRREPSPRRDRYRVEGAWIVRQVDRNQTLHLATGFSESGVTRLLQTLRRETPRTATGR